MKRIALIFSITALASACAPAPPVTHTEPAAPTVSPQQRLTAVLAAAGGDDKELSVQPLRDPQVEDLRIKAAQAMQAHDYPRAADALNQALLIVADDPAVLQERAEVALAQGDYPRAETLAKRAIELGSAVGPLCRKHWATIEQSEQALGHNDEAAAAHAKIEACTVAGVNRM
jgi:Flp pilus assembly protein TadD